MFDQMLHYIALSGGLLAVMPVLLLEAVSVAAAYLEQGDVALV